MGNHTCSIVIPVYNSQESLPVLVGQLLDEMPLLATDFEIILVNDGSSDQSWQVIEQASKMNQCIRGFDLVHNFGQHNALLCGIRAARKEIVITMDDDLQHPVTEIGKLLDKIDEGWDVVYGTPLEEMHGFWRDISSRLVKWSLKTTLQVSYAEKISAFRAFRTDLRDIFSNYSNTFVSIDVLLSWGTGRIGFVGVKHMERKTGRSQYTFLKLLLHLSNLVLGFSVVPLRVASFLGFFFTFFGFILLAYVLIRYLVNGGVVPGFAFLASAISIFSGIQLFVLGIIGEYLSRMYTNLMVKPPYIIYRQT